MLYSNLSPMFNNVYAQILQNLESDFLQILSRRAQSGTFLKREIKGRDYWYYQYRQSGKLHEIYIGADSPVLSTAVESLHSTGTEIRDLVRSAVGLGGHVFRRHDDRILSALAGAGTFRAGGVLVGTGAFLSYQNLLGIRWKTASSVLGTGDIDIAHFDRFAVGVPPAMDIPMADVLKTLDASPVFALATKGLPAFHTVLKTYRIDFLVPAVGPVTEDKTVFVSALNTQAQPLRFLDFLLENPVRAAAFVSGNIALSVNVPDPARFAVHKLILSERRLAQSPAKAKKDRQQAICLLECLNEQNPSGLEEAFEEARARGPKWTKYLNAAYRKLPVSERLR